MSSNGEKSKEGSPPAPLFLMSGGEGLTLTPPSLSGNLLLPALAAEPTLANTSASSAAPVLEEAESPAVESFVGQPLPESASIQPPSAAQSSSDTSVSTSSSTHSAGAPPPPAAAQFGPPPSSVQTSGAPPPPVASGGTTGQHNMFRGFGGKRYLGETGLDQASPFPDIIDV